MVPSPTPTRLGLALAGTLLAASLSLCSATAEVSPPPSDAVADPVVATVTGAEIRQSDIERELRFVPHSEIRWRDHMEIPQGQRWRDWIHRMSLRAIATLAAEAQGLRQDPAIEELARKSERDWLNNQYHLAFHGVDFKPPSAEELRRELGVSPILVPARLRLSHIFLRTRDEEGTTRAKTQLALWKSEITTLESFREVATDHSDSQTARRGGRLGFLRRGTLSPSIEEALYKLPEGAISDPLEMRGGVHLFFIERSIPAQARPLKPRLNKLRGGKVETARNQSHRQALALAKGRFKVQRRSDGGFAVGQHVVDGATFVVRYPRDPGKEDERREQIIEAELLFQWALAMGWPDEGHTRRLRDLRADAYLGQLLDRQRQQRLVLPTESDLRQRYDAEPDQHINPRRIDIKAVKARVPAEQDPLIFMDILIQLARRLRAGELTWEEAVTRCQPGCELVDPAILDGLKIASRFGPRVMEALREIEVGGVTNPVQQDHDFFVVTIEAESPRARMTFEEAKARLTRKITGERKKALNGQVVNELLDAYRFTFTEAGLARMGAAPAP